MAAMMASASLLSFAHAMAPSVAAHGNQPCYDGTSQTYLSGINYNSNAWVNGVYAQIDFRHDACGDDSSGVSAWIALVPDTHTQGAIVQLGIIQCKNGWNPRWATDPCFNHPDELRYVTASGGCTTSPFPKDLGPATDGIHSYKIERTADGFLLTINNTDQWLIGKSDPSIFCWYDDPMDSQYAVEKADRGDSSGGQTTRTHFLNEKHRDMGSNSWIFIDALGGDCHMVMNTAPHTSFCSKLAAEMWAWD